jgi:hypothetical protein
MDSNSLRESRVLWSFWIACGLAVTGGVAPLVFAAGGTNRIAGAIIPFGVAAIALGAAALTYHQGRQIATALYFVAGLALVYGMLSIIAVPLRLAVVGTCPAPPAVCPPGFEHPFTTSEGSGFAIGIAMGTLAILVGFFGLLMLYRIRSQPSWTPHTRIEKPVTAPETPIATEPATAPVPELETATPMEPAAEAVISAPPAESVASSPVLPPKPPRKPRAKRPPKPPAELPAPEERPELPAPEEPLELPAHEPPSSK